MPIFSSRSISYLVSGVRDRLSQGYKGAYFVMVQLGSEVWRPRLILRRVSIPLSMNSLCKVSLLLSEPCPLDVVLELLVLIRVLDRFRGSPDLSSSFTTTYSGG